MEEKKSSKHEMGFSKKNGEEDPKAFVKFIFTVVGTLGGFTAVFAVLGYVIVLSFASSMNLYGLADFPLQFYKEAVISFLRDIIKFYSSRPYMLFVWLTLFLPLLDFGRIYFCKNLLKFLRKYLSLFIVLAVIVLTLKLNMFRAGFMGVSALKAKDLKDLSLFAVSLPTLFATFVYLAYNFSGFALKKFKMKFGILFIFFVLLCLSIPIGYGTSIYDIPLYRVRGIECKDPLKVFEMSPTSEFNVFYLMGHTSGREIFFDATTFPASPIIVDRELIKTVKVSDDHNKPMTLRGLMEEAGVVWPTGKVSRSAISEEDRKWQEYVK